VPSFPRARAIAFGVIVVFSCAGAFLTACASLAARDHGGLVDRANDVDRADGLRGRGEFKCRLSYRRVDWRRGFSI
jgi:hypothetical protein